MFSWYGLPHFFKHFVTIPVSPVTTGIIVHFTFHIRFVSVHTLLYSSFFSASFCMAFVSAGVITSEYTLFLFSVFNYFIWPICHNFLCVCVRAYHFLSFWGVVLCVRITVNVHQLCRVSLRTRSSPEWGILRLGGQQFLHVVYIIDICCQFLPSKCYF